MELYFSTWDGQRGLNYVQFLFSFHCGCIFSTLVQKIGENVVFGEVKLNFSMGSSTRSQQCNFNVILG